MKTKTEKQSGASLKNNQKYNGVKVLVLLLFSILFFSSQLTFAHCDSYDGPTVKDAYKALETNNVQLVLKWIDESQEAEIISLFNKTYKLKSGDKEIYAIVEKHFLETLVRLHRETEGAPYSGLKAAGTTKKIVTMSDNAIATANMDDFLVKFNNHVNGVIKEKYNKVIELEKTKNESSEKGRAYVKAYVEYTHTIEGVHDLIEHSANGHAMHKH